MNESSRRQYDETFMKEEQYKLLVSQIATFDETDRKYLEEITCYLKDIR